MHYADSGVCSVRALLEDKRVVSRCGYYSLAVCWGEQKQASRRTQSLRGKLNKLILQQPLLLE